MIVPVESRSDLRAFVNLPWSLYRQAPGWTPPYRTSDLRFHDPERGPFFTFGSAQPFLSRDGRRIRGRITAHVNHAYNAHHGTSVGGFGLLDAEPKESVVTPLVNAAEDWLSRHECRSVWGPMEFCLYARVGLQIDGFERPLPMSTTSLGPSACARRGWTRETQRWHAFRRFGGAVYARYQVLEKPLASETPVEARGRRPQAEIVRLSRSRG